MFINVGMSILPTRRPLAARPFRSYYYGIFCSQSVEVQIAPHTEYTKSYILVADTLSRCCEAQKQTQSLVYIVPRFPAQIQQKHNIQIGVHPHSKDDEQFKDKNIPCVSASESHTCQVYINLHNDEGVRECMVNGGMVVTNSQIDGLYDGYNCVVGLSNTKWMKYNKVIAENARTGNFIHNKDVFRWMWHLLLTTPCPVKTNNNRNGFLLHARFLIIHCILYGKKSLSYAINKKERPKNSVLIVDNRRDVGTVLSAHVSICNLKPGWDITIFCSDNNETFMRQAFPNAIVKVIQNYPTRSFFIEEYNRLVKSESFWNAVRADKILLVQNDGTLVRKGVEDHPCFSYKYVGAPWRHHPYLSDATSGNLVGNGGLTIRDVQECKRVCKEYASERLHVYEMCPVMSEAEDVFFSKRMDSVCPNNLAKEFSMEQVQNESALGYHRFWAYHSVAFCMTYFENLLSEAFV